MKILVTGGAGFIGSNFIHYWLSRHPDDDLYNLDVLTYAGNSENLAGLENNAHYHFIKEDITEKRKMAELIPEMDLVVHFAAESHVDRSIADSSAFVRTNVLGTQVLLEAARIKGTRFHHVSTDEVFGSLLSADPAFEESTPYDPRSPYSATKAASDHLVRAYWHTYGLPITISNCSNNYGPRQFPEKLIPLAITNLLTGKKVPVYGAGLNVRDWIYVDDHNAGLEAIIQLGRMGETYCLGGLSERPNIEIVHKILNILGFDESWIETVADRPGHDLRYAINIAKIRAELGWQPVTDLDQGLIKTIEWYKLNQSWWSPLIRKEI